MRYTVTFLPVTLLLLTVMLSVPGACPYVITFRV